MTTNPRRPRDLSSGPFSSPGDFSLSGAGTLAASGSHSGHCVLYIAFGVLLLTLRPPP